MTTMAGGIAGGREEPGVGMKAAFESRWGLYFDAKARPVKALLMKATATGNPTGLW
jgi:hypothetical protein